MSDTQNIPLQIAKHLSFKFILLLSLCIPITMAKAENPYQAAHRLQMQLQVEQKEPVGLIGISPSQVQTQDYLQQESIIQQQKMQNLQREINQLKQQRQEEQEQTEEQEYNQ